MWPGGRRRGSNKKGGELAANLEFLGGFIAGFLRGLKTTPSGHAALSPLSTGGRKDGGRGGGGVFEKNGGEKGEFGLMMVIIATLGSKSYICVYEIIHF